MLGVQLPRRARVDHDQPGLGPEVPREAPAVARRVLVRAVGERVEQVGGVVLPGALVGGDLLPDRVCRPLGGREVAEVLVDPVRREPRHHPLVPPGGRLHLLLPVERGVPVVADVVVVEDHRAGHGGEQPAVRGVGPRQPVELGVLLVVLELGARLLVEVAARLDELPHLLGGVVGVDLVAQEQHHVGPAHRGAGVRVVGVAAVGDAGHPQGVGAQRVDPVRGVAGRVVRHRRAARPEREPQGLRVVERGDHRGRVGRVHRRPDGHPVDVHGVGVLRARLEAVEGDQCVVVPVHDEGAGPAGAGARGDRDLAGPGHLHPDRGVVLVDEAEQRAEDEVVHGPSRPRGRGSGKTALAAASRQ